MNTRQLYSVCYPCVAAAANGLDSVEDPANAEWLTGWRTRYALATKHVNGEPWLVEYDGDVEPFYFSWSPCEFCGETLAGDRADCAILEKH